MKNIIFYIGLIFYSFNAFGQDIHFSQINRAPFILNPSFTGAFSGNFRGTVNWKDQWRSVNNTFRTYAASGEFNFAKGRARKPTFYGIGFFASRDVAGDIEVGNTNVGVSFSSLFKISRNQRITVGAQSAVGSFGLNTQKMEWGSQYKGLNFDPTLINGEGVDYTTFQYLDMAVGIGYWYYQNDRNVKSRTPQDAKFGISVYHVNKPTYSYQADKSEKLPMKFVAHGAMLFSLNKPDLYWYPNVTAFIQGGQHQIVLGSLWKYMLNTGSRNTGNGADVAITGGLSTRITNVIDAIIPQVILDVQYFSFGLSYDINVSSLSKASNYRGGFELSIRFTNPDGYTHRNPFRRAVTI
ncbi:PorP/SprF family type IX secretion system membrane protein [Crocinitomix catalasitica]|uniref:PorP/SprF family type IX secretion system membrane protein n=1 Tax=Crocinitomix catalasitica TaxID=184607 RepID=UPI000486C7A5|nr:PorP/SprF family type IX secretion system membrane protein [Crocinitomix catalasitica]